jgi:heme A synthase
VEGKNLMLAREQSRLFMSHILLAIIVVLSACWITWRLDRVEIKLSSLVDAEVSRADIISQAMGLFAGGWKQPNHNSEDTHPQ